MMKLNKQEKKILTKLEPLHLMRADLKSQLAMIETQIRAYETQIQALDPRKLIGGKAWFNGVELYTFKRTTCAHKSVTIDLVEMHKIPQEDLRQSIEKHSKTNQCLKTRLGGI